MSNDWGQEKEKDTPVEIVCEDCESKYHYENTCGHDYLVPNGLRIPEQDIDEAVAVVMSHWNDDNNPMVGMTVAVAVSIRMAAEEGKF